MDENHSKISLKFIIIAFIFLLLLLLGGFIILRLSRNNRQTPTLPSLNTFGNKIEAESRVEGFELFLVDKRKLMTFLQERRFFQNGVILSDIDERTPVSSLKIVLTPQIQDKLVFNWEYPNETTVGTASGWEVIDGELYLRIYIKNNSDGISSSNANQLINSQLLRSLLHLTRTPNIQENPELIVTDFYNENEEQDYFVLLDTN